MNSSSLHPDAFLDASTQIGQKLVDEAFWHEGRCNWIGAEPVERRERGERAPLTYRTLGPDLYSGTSGVALFLAELYAVTHNPDFRRSALGAIHHSLACCESIPSRLRLGLFTGWTGVALAAVRIGRILDERELDHRARNLMVRVLAEQFDPSEFDMISGRAGAISALIVLHFLLKDYFLIDSAIRLGHELVSAAEESGCAISWKVCGVRSHHDLTGFSHGTAGAAYSLLELYSTTGISAFRNSALAAFQYERRWFNAPKGNWPDFRADSSTRTRRPSMFPCLSFWCHGAPGIALSRLRAYELLNDELSLAEALVALETTHKSVLAAHTSGMGNFSLCHGVCGNAEAILYGSQIVDSRAQDTETLHSVAFSAIERFGQRESVWPCGTHVGETPGLMLGLSGIGHHFLRLYDPSVPAISILRKHQWQSL